MAQHQHELHEIARQIGHGKALMACRRCSYTKVVKVAMQPVQ